MNEYKEILQAIKELDNKVDGLRDDILLSREDIRYVRKLIQVYITKPIRFGSCPKINTDLICSMINTNGFNSVKSWSH